MNEFFKSVNFTMFMKESDHFDIQETCESIF